MLENSQNDCLILNLGISLRLTGGARREPRPVDMHRAGLCATQVVGGVRVRSGALQVRVDRGRQRAEEREGLVRRPVVRLERAVPHADRESHPRAAHG